MNVRMAIPLVLMLPALLAAPLPACAQPEAAAAVLRGSEGWLYFRPELRHLSFARFWGADAAAASRARRPDRADPLPAILDFARQLDQRGTTLVLVPVPAKAVIHPEGLPEPERAVSDAGDQAFFALLRERGVDVLDLTAAFRALREADGTPVYLKQDTHWGDRGIREAARLIAERLGERGVARRAAPAEWRTRERDVEIDGDLRRMLADAALARERIRVTEVGRGASFEPIPPDRESPVLLLGDSHALVLHAGGDLHARGAGLPDHLARELGFPVDLLAVRGSGATPARMDLLRRGDGLAGKRALVWCLTVREFTESSQGWRVLPVAR